MALSAREFAVASNTDAHGGALLLPSPKPLSIRPVPSENSPHGPLHHAMLTTLTVLGGVMAAVQGEEPLPASMRDVLEILGALDDATIGTTIDKFLPRAS